MKHYIKTNAIILKSIKINDADRLIIFFTPNYGKRKGVVRAIRKGNNKYRGNIEVGNIVNFIFYSKDEHKEIVKIIDIETLEPFLEIRKNWHKLLSLSYLLNVLDEAFPLHDVHSDLYFVFVKHIIELQMSDDAKISIILRLVELEILNELGIGRNFGVCSKCGNRIQTDGFFNGYNFNVMCNQCHESNSQNDIYLTHNFFKFHRNVLKSHKSDFYDSQVDTLAKQIFRKIFFDYLGHKMKALEILESLPW